MYKKLIDIFIEKNKQINLSAIRDAQWVDIKHIKDSLVWLKIIKKNIWKTKNLSIVDVWTWSWFPILPLAIEEKSWKFTGIESVKKKVNAINEIIDQLWLNNIEIIWTRAEDYNKKKFDILIARAVAYIDKLLKFTYHLIKKWGYFVLYKLDSLEEYEDMMKYCKKYNLELIEKHYYKLFDDDIQRVIYVLKRN